jgi:hypothetical protein
MDVRPDIIRERRQAMSTPTADSVALNEPTLPPSISSTCTESNQVEREDAEDFDYKPVPRPKVVNVSVRYHVRGRGKPLPYVMDDGCEE